MGGGVEGVGGGGDGESQERPSLVQKAHTNYRSPYKPVYLVRP